MGKFIISENQLKQISDIEDNNVVKVLCRAEKYEFGGNRCSIRRKRDGKQIDGVLFDVFLVKDNGTLQLHGIFSNGVIIKRDYETREIVEKKKLSSDEVTLYYNKENCCYRDLFRLAKKRECRNMTFDEELWENKSSISRFEYLIEQNGVGNWKYKEAIAKVCKSAQHELLEELYWNRDAKELELKIPYNITSEIDYINDLSITVLAKLHTYAKAIYGNYDYHYAGEFTLNKDIYLDENKKLNKVSIVVDCQYDENGFIYQNHLYETLFHELNHAYELYCRLLKNEKIENAEQTTQYTKNYNLNIIDISSVFFDIKDETIKNNMIKITKDIVYELLNDSEVNAKVAQVYGELEQMYQNNARINKYDAMKQCYTYKLFTILNIHSAYFIQHITNNQINRLIPIIKNLGLNIKQYSKSDLVSKIKKQLKKLRNGIYRTTGLFFADVYDRQPNNRTFIKKINFDEMKLPKDYKVTYVLD